MGLFGFGNKENVVDLAERVRQQKEDERENGHGSDSSAFSDSDTSEEKRRKLAKRIAGIIDRLDELSTKLYHLQQRIELVEKKLSVRTE